jgi:hypothetical protein
LIISYASQPFFFSLSSSRDAYSRPGTNNLRSDAEKEGKNVGSLLAFARHYYLYTHSSTSMAGINVAIIGELPDGFLRDDEEKGEGGLLRALSLPPYHTGVGLVGTEVISQLTTVTSLTKTISIAALQNSKKTLLLDASSTLDARDWKSQLANSPTSALSLPDLTSHLSKLDRHTVVIDNTSSEDVASFYPSFLRAGLSVVTPNKKGFSSSLELYKEIVAASTSGTNKGPLVYGESTVGAGLPILSTIRDLLETGDEIHKIEGVLSGTLSYIFNEWSTPDGSEKKFSDIVKIAKEQGYTVSWVRNPSREA